MHSGWFLWQICVLYMKVSVWKESVLQNKYLLESGRLLIFVYCLLLSRPFTLSLYLPIRSSLFHPSLFHPSLFHPSLFHPFTLSPLHSFTPSLLFTCSISPSLSLSCNIMQRLTSSKETAFLRCLLSKCDNICTCNFSREKLRLIITHM